jgi:hypothetical protein
MASSVVGMSRPQRSRMWTPRRGRQQFDLLCHDKRPELGGKAFELRQFRHCWRATGPYPFSGYSAPLARPVPGCDLRDMPRHAFATHLYLLVVIGDQQIYYPVEPGSRWC